MAYILGVDIGTSGTKNGAFLGGRYSGSFRYI